MASEGLVDWRGKPINTKVHGGVRAAWYLYLLVVVNFLVHMPNFQNLPTYLREVMHMGVSDTSTTLTNLFGAMSGFALLGGFLSDSYITCARTMLLCVPLVTVGYVLLTLQSHFPSLHPAPCNNSAAADASSCRQVHGWGSALLYIALYLITFGEGVMRACIPALGSDQFDGDDPVEARQKSSFFNWFTFCLSIGSVAGLILIVWLQNAKGWDIGFGLSTVLTLVALLVYAAGLPLYRNRVPQGSALTRVLQVFVVAFKNRKLEQPDEKIEETQQSSDGVDSQEVPCHTPATNDSLLKFLDKACAVNTTTGGGDGNGPWSICSAAKVEETKIILRMLPLVFSATLSHVSGPVLFPFTIQQAMATNTKLGKVHVYPAMLFIVPTVIQTLLLVVYDQILVPRLRRRTGYTGGITQLQRVAVGFLAMSFAPAVAAIIERKRKDTVAAGDQMSIFWLSPQFFLIGVADTMSYVGLLEFFTNEAPDGMKSIGVALFWCQSGLASLLATLMVRLVNRVTHTSRHPGWLEGKNLNSSNLHLDRFYWVVTVVAFLGWINYLYWAKRYKYRHDPRISTKSSSNEEDDHSSMP